MKDSGLVYFGLYGACSTMAESLTLAAAAIGREIGIIDSHFFNAIIVLSIVTTLPIPSLVRWVIARHRSDFDAECDLRLPMVVHDDELL